MFDARKYLQVDLPRLFALAPRDKMTGQVVIQMMVVDRSDCDIYYRVSAEGVWVGEGLANEGDLLMAFISEDLAAFSEHRLDTARAVRSQRLKVLGDENILLWMADLLGEVAVAG